MRKTALFLVVNPGRLLTSFRTAINFCLIFMFLSVTSYAEEVFKEPVLLWEREFSPAIRELSDQNTDGDFIAVQMDKMGIRGEKLLVLDNKGKTKREELLPKRKKRTIPAEQLWLTATGDEEFKQLKKTKKPKQVLIHSKKALGVKTTLVGTLCE